MEQGRLNGKDAVWRHRVIERLAAIRLHAGVMRRLVRRQEHPGGDVLVDQIEQIERNVAEATSIIEELPPAMA